MAVKLTNCRVKGAKYDGKTLCVLWDSAIKGFGLRVYPSGRKTWILRYRDEDKRLRVRTMDEIDQMTLDEARYEAKRILAKNSRRQKLMSSFAGAPTFKKFSEEWLDKHAKQHRSSWPNDQGKLTKHILPKIGDLSLGSIKAMDLLDLHKSISGEYPVAANRCIELIRAIYNKAKKWGVYKGENPAEAVEKNKETGRDRWVTPEEIPNLLTAIEEEKNIWAQKAILLYLFTGCRKSEILRAKWTDVDFKNNLLKIRKTKTGDIYYKALSQQAMEVIFSIPIIKGNPHLIVGAKKGQHLVNLWKPFDRVRKKAKLQDVRIHDLRHTVASWLAMNGESLPMIGGILDHSNPKTTQRYAHLQKHALREALDRIGNIMLTSQS